MITPKNTNLARVMDEARFYKRVIFFHVIAGFAAAICPFYLHGHWMPSITAVLICVINVFRYRAIAKRASWTGISDTYLSFDGEKLSCRNIVGTVYESCLIYVSEIESVIELTKKGECGFLVVLKEMEGGSFIAVNQKIVAERVFEVDGSMYDAPEFVELYEEFLQALPEEARRIHVRREHKNWWPVSRRKNLFQAALPWVFVIGACAAEYALQVLSI